jgi:hypothetical protein
MIRHYRFDAHGALIYEPDWIAWTAWALTVDFQLADTTLGGDDPEQSVRVSTVFLGVDVGGPDDPPRPFETMIFGGPAHGRTWRYGTAAAARTGHDCACLEAALALAQKGPRHD